MDLFESSLDTKHQPFAYRMRPENLDEYIGQDHIVSEGRLLRRMIQADQLSSIIFYGPPGTGKTTLARVIANSTKSIFITMNAVLSGVKNLREEIDLAKERLSLHGKRTILFIDEIHRWNKAQQDALLPWVENGTIILIGATTQNPYFEVNSALVSRSRIFQLKDLTKDNLMGIALQSLDNKIKGYGRYNIKFEPDALEHIVDIANGDARSLLNALELAVETTGESFPPKNNNKIYITLETAEESIQQKVVLYDKEGDYHFDIISAFIKSIRGSDPDAVLYWLAKMVKAGEDPHYIFRRMLISASEDIGLADPNGLVIVESAAAAFDRVGLPEGRYHLTHAALYLATAPKSNSALGFFDALKTIEKEQNSQVPNHLKDAGRDKEGFGHGEGYLYPHAYREHWVAQQYLPRTLQGKVFYNPSSTGYEAEIKNEVLRKREAQIESQNSSSFPEILTTAPPDKNRDRWFEKLLQGRGEILKDIQTTVFNLVDIRSHHIILDLNAGSGLLLWEASRRVREGGIYGLTSSLETLNYLQEYGNQIPEMERPIIENKKVSEFVEEKKGKLKFDIIMGRNTLINKENKLTYNEYLMDLNTPGGKVILAETLLSESTRLSSLLVDLSETLERTDQIALDLLIKAEKIIYSPDYNSIINWKEKDFVNWMTEAGYSAIKSQKKIYSEHRTITVEDIKSWIDPHGANINYGNILVNITEENELEQLKITLNKYLAGKYFDWKTSICFVRGTA
ncbi:MAG: AAA family ATPase [Spirochaetia bacterium]|jgi:putative ATPase|nr:AAA family ATPase [Spirochaetia bacterium]